MNASVNAVTALTNIAHEAMESCDYNTFRLTLEGLLEEAETKAKLEAEAERARREQAEKELAQRQAKLTEIMSNAMSGCLAGGDIAYMLKLYVKQFDNKIDKEMLDYIVDADSVGELVKCIVDSGRAFNTLVQTSGHKLTSSQIVNLCKEAESKDMSEKEMDQQIRDFINRVM